MNHSSQNNVNGAREQQLVRQRYRRLRPMVLAGLMSLLCACTSGPPPKLYLLEPALVQSEVLEVPLKQSRFAALGISPVELPGYASNPQIAGLAADGTVYQEDQHRWAEEPEAAISRVLAERLKAHTGATVLIEPWPRDFLPDARIEVEFGRLLREPMGGAELSGQILLLSGDGRKLRKAVPFEVVHYGRDVDRRVFFVAVAQGIDDIARMAVRALTE